MIGGYVSRGSAIPALRGAYVFGDFCGRHLQGLRVLHDGVRDHFTMNVDVVQLTSFAEDRDGELYLTSLDGGVFRLEADPAVPAPLDERMSA
ncbi:MAG: hypothetical protein ACRDZ7_17145 [Acidimicrobiia bacterium]